jgi:hypothetical protein
VGVGGRAVLLRDQSDDGQPLPLLDSRQSGSRTEERLRDRTPTNFEDPGNRRFALYSR